MGFWSPFLSAALLCLGCAGTPEPPPDAPPSHARLPEVTVIDLERRPVTLAEVADGRPALVSLWATWCKACAREFDALNRLHDKLGDRALVIGVAEGDSFDQVRGFIELRRIRYAQVIDERFLLADALGTDRVPATLVIGRDGVVHYSGGALDAAALDALRAALGE